MRKRRFLRFAAAGAGVVVIAGVGIAAPASATSPTGYGFDNQPHTFVLGGSDTTYNAMNKLTTLWNAALGCPTSTGNNVPPAATNNCTLSNTPETNTLGNYEHDTMANAFPAGSSTGIGSLFGFPTVGAAGDVGNSTYAGAVNGTPGIGSPGVTSSRANVDAARSSRAPITAAPFTGTKCNPGAVAASELTCSTFWGFAEDGIAILPWNAPANAAFAGPFTAANAAWFGRADEVRADAAGLTTSELFNIYTCVFHVWSDIPSLGIAKNGPLDGPIVAWGMNSASGTFGTFNSYVATGPAAHAGFNADTSVAGCAHQLTPAAGNIYPFENDTKPIVTDVNTNGMIAAAGAGQPATAAGIGTGVGGGPGVPGSTCDPAAATYASCLNNPMNWIWFGSNGVTTAYPFTSNFTVTPPAQPATAFVALAGPTGTDPGPFLIPSTANIGGGTYPALRTLYHVTRKANVVAGSSYLLGTDDANCSAFGCNFTSTVNPGPGIGPGGGTAACSNGGGFTTCDLRVDGVTARTAGDGVTTTASNVVTSATAAFVAGDLGLSIGGYGIPTGSTITGITNATTVTISNNAEETTPAIRTDAAASTTAGSTTIGDVAAVAGDIGKFVTGPGIPPGAYATGATAGVSLTISVPATATASPVSIEVGGTQLDIGGVDAAVREFTRFLCRVSAAQQTKDTLTGTNLFSEITSAINADGFTTVPVAQRSAGSRCKVLG
jgi:hypothetical protein